MCSNQPDYLIGYWAGYPHLDFEPEANGHQPLLLVTRRQQPDDLLIRIDSVSAAQHGRGSLLLDASRAEEPEATFVSFSLPAAD